MQDFEKLGAFYLGKLFDVESDRVLDDLLLYDAKDLTTHAVCVGMTGSGKTGLCLSLLEEAAIDGIPAIAIDPKGDLGNLALAFPELRPSDFQPWVDAGDAARRGLTIEQHAAATAALWKKGLDEWGQDGARIARFRDAAELAIYTPGSSAGLQLQVLRSLAAPPAALAGDADALRERVMAAVSGLLALVGIDADPIRSREQILLSNLVQAAWSQGRDLEIAELIREIQNPPFDRVGVLDLESFFPPKERFELAMALNNLLASPGFAAWMEGEPIDVARLLWTPDGRPRIAILSIAHLSDAERMFFVTLLLNEVVAWMRAQPGTASLRALLYMDEVFGFFPPSANPPSKTPLLTLMKQARAFGLGVVLATQNPVDLDYKGLSNAGTWFLGRLQTERDKARVIEGLEGVAGSAGSGFDRARMEAMLAGLKSRVFLMNNVHESGPTLFHSRWALSYLRGPLTRTQIGALMQARAPRVTGPPAAAPLPPAKAPVAVAASAAPLERPVLPPDVEELFLPAAGTPVIGERWLLRPALLGTARLHFVNAKLGVDTWRTVTLLTGLDEANLAEPWAAAAIFERGEPALSAGPTVAAPSFAALPAEAASVRSYAAWGRKLADHLYRSRELTIFRCAELGESSQPGEPEGEFRVRLAQRAREQRDLEKAKLEKKYASRFAGAEERIRRAEERVSREQSQYGQQKVQTAISFGATLLGAFLGRKKVSVGNVGRATTAVRGLGRASREREDVERAGQALEAEKEKLAELQQEFDAELERVRRTVDPSRLEIDALPVKPRKSDIQVVRVVLAWTPWRVDAQGIAVPASGPPA